MLAMTQLGLSLHELGMMCCDRGCPVEKEEGLHECHCEHSMKVEQVVDVKSSEKEYLKEPECNT